MRKTISLIIMVLFACSIVSAIDLDRFCNDSKRISRKFLFQSTNINKIRLECKKVISLKLRVRKITGLNNLKSRKILPLKTFKRVIEIVKAENVKMGRLGRSYQAIKKYAVNLRKNIFLLNKEITRLTEKWKNQKLLKFKKNCLFSLLSKIKKLKKEVKAIKLTSFSYENLNSLDISRKMGEISSVNSGDEYKADEAKLRAKRWEMMESIADSEIDEAKNNYEDAKEQFKLALRILSEHMERQTQVIQKITS